MDAAHSPSTLLLAVSFAGPASALTFYVDVAEALTQTMLRVAVLCAGESHLHPCHRRAWILVQHLLGSVVQSAGYKEH